MKKWIISIFLLIAVPSLISCSDEEDTYLGYIDAHYFYLSSSVAGRLITCLAERGDQVQAGQVLYQLDPNPEASELKQAVAELDQSRQQLANLIEGQRDTIIEEIVAQQKQAEAKLTLAAQDLHRYEALYQVHAVSKSDYDSRVATYRSANEKVKELQANLDEAKLGARKYLISAQQADVQAQQANVEQLEWTVAQKTMRAPKAGMIFDEFYHPGEFIPAGASVLALLPPTSIRVKFYLPETVLAQIKIGQKIHFSCDQCAREGVATIYYIAQQAEYTPPVIYSRDSREKLVYRVEAKMAPQEAVLFHPGQPVEVHLHTS